LNRLGWAILALFVLLGTGFALLLGGDRAPPSRTEAADAVPATPAAPPAATGPLPGGRLLVPVAGVPRHMLADSWGDPRGGGARAHQGLDVMAARGTPVVAAAAGRIEKLFDSDQGGLTIYVRSDDGGTVYYYAHLDRRRPDLVEGQAVRAGELLGTVGSSGNAGPDAPHLHFEVKRMAAGERWHQGEAVNPYPLLAAGGRTR